MSALASLSLFEPRATVIGILILSFGLLVSDALRYDVVALLVVLALAVTGALEPAQAFAGFSSDAVLVVAAMCVFGEALSRWGVAESVCERIFSGKSYGERGLVLRLSLVSGALASIMSDSAVVAILIPIAHSIGRKRDIPISRLLIPVSFGCFLGDLLVVIGSVKNIALNGALVELGARPFGMFEFTSFGLLVMGTGIVYLAGPGRRLLPKKPLEKSYSQQYALRDFVTEVHVESTSSLVQRRVADLGWPRDYAVTVLGIVRGAGGGTVLAPGPYNLIRAGDALLLQGEPAAVLKLSRELGVGLGSGAPIGDAALISDDVRLVECVVPAGSRLIGSTLSESGLRARTGLNVLGISQAGGGLAQKLAETRLSVGDTLLAQGHKSDIERARVARELLVLGELERAPASGKAWTTVLLLALVLTIAVTGTQSLAIAAIAGAVGLVLTGCVPGRSVYAAIDWSVIVLIGGMLALGRAFDRHGLGEALAERAIRLQLLADSPVLVMGLLCVLAIVLAQVATSVGTTVILAPVALSLASELGVSDRPLLMAVLAGANCAFLSPVANAANAMVVGPGGYKFRDFLRVGLPLTAIVVTLACVALPYLFPF